MTGSPVIRQAPDLPPGPRAALVIATASYHDSALDQLRATADDAQALTEVLSDPGIGGFAVTPVIDADERQVRRAVEAFLTGRATGDVVLVYLSCHGVLDWRNRLYFAAADTLKDQLGSTGIAAAWLMEQLEECRARQQVVILDCCFSGAFAKGSKGDGELNLERRLAGSGRGRAVLTASRSGEYSFTGDALPGAAVSGSVFTAGLVEGLRTGTADAGGDGYVSVDEAYDFAYRYVLRVGAAQTPQRWLSGGEGVIVLARSPAGVAIAPATLPEDLADALDSRYPTIRIGVVHELGSWLASDDPGRALTAEQKLRQIANNDNPTVATAARAYLTTAGQFTAGTSPHTNRTAKDEATATAPAEKAPEPVRTISHHAARLFADAERIAQAMTDEEAKAWALSEVAGAVAATNPDHAARLFADAERIAQAITDEDTKATALGRVAGAVAATNPDHAARLFADAERIAQAITNEQIKVWTLGRVARAVAATNPDRAERIAQAITNEQAKAWALSEAAGAVAATNPDHAARLFADAERIAQAITDEEAKARVLAEVAWAVAATNPDRAERIAQAITDKRAKAWALSEAAGAVAATNPDHAARLFADAERIAQAITDKRAKAWALGRVAGAVAATDPDRAERIAQAITDKQAKASALGTVARAVAATDPDRAERIAQAITDEQFKAWALSEVAGAVAATDPDRAERIAQAITDEQFKAWALSEVAGAVAATDPDRAERIAQAITDKRVKASVLSRIALATL